MPPKPQCTSVPPVIVRDKERFPNAARLLHKGDGDAPESRLPRPRVRRQRRQCHAQHECDTDLPLLNQTSSRRQSNELHVLKQRAPRRRPISPTTILKKVAGCRTLRGTMPETSERNAVRTAVGIIFRHSRPTASLSPSCHRLRRGRGKAPHPASESNTRPHHPHPNHP